MRDETDPERPDELEETELEETEPVEAEPVETDEAGGVAGLVGLLTQTPLLEDEMKSVVSGRVHYECSAWSGESRRFLAATLTMREIPHAWQGTELLVPGDREDEVDLIVEELIGMAQPALDVERDKIVYEVGEWSAAQQTAIAELLGSQGIPYEWDEGGDLVVYADDEERVEAVFDELPDEADVDGHDDGLGALRELDLLLVAARRLHKRPDDAAAIVDVATAAERLEHLRVPFGVEPSDWRTLVERARALRDALDATDEDVPDEEIREMAEGLERLVRTFT